MQRIFFCSVPMPQALTAGSSSAANRASHARAAACALALAVFLITGLNATAFATEADPRASSGRLSQPLSKPQIRALALRDILFGNSPSRRQAAGLRQQLICGDALADVGEQCDDGNLIDGDGCSSTCEIEAGFECTAPIAPQPDGTIADGGFETGTPNSAWTEASATFPNVVCNPLLCGGSNATISNQGFWWVWIGGSLTPEVASVEQSVLLPSTADTLSFALATPACDSADDFMRLTIDGNEVFRVQGDDVNCGLSGYRNIDIDLVAALGGPYNDDATHVLRFEGETFATNGADSSFFVDDVLTGLTAAVPSQCTELPLVCYEETFNASVAGDFSLLGWSAFNTGALALDWITTDTVGAGSCGDGIGGLPGNFTGGSGDAACIDTDANDADVVNAYLCSSPIDLSEAVSPELEFRNNFQIFRATGEDAFEVLVGTVAPDALSIANYTSELLLTESSGTLLGLPGAEQSVDLAAYAGQSEVYACFRYSGDFDWYAQVDDVTVTAPVCTDSDEDGVDDAQDNCLLVENASQLDTDNDGYGNICDGDFDNNCTTDFLDLQVMKDNFFLTGDLLTDMDGDMNTNFADLSVLKAIFFLPPGPSGVVDTCEAR